MGEEMEKEKGVVMDTPERTQIATPLSKFEDSPVFNYINSLSPIKPVKSVYITQTFSSLSFASLPSVFTSPHVSSLKESRFLRRHQFSDSSKPELTSDDAKKVGTSDRISSTCRGPLKQQKALGPDSSVTATSVVPLYECSNLKTELPRTLSYESVSPDTKNVPKLAAASALIVPLVPDSSANGLLRSETQIEGIGPIDHNKEVSACDWDSLISDASELLNFDSPSDAPAGGQSMLDLADFPSVTTDTAKAEAADGIGPTEQHASENPSENSENLDTSETQEILTNNSLTTFGSGEPSENIDNEGGSNSFRGMRRRCLVFEMVGSRRKHLEDGSSCGSLNVSESKGTIASSGKHSVPLRTGNDSSRCILPGIGLHLNALATTSVDHKVVKHEASGSGGQLIIAPQSASAYHSMCPGQDSLDKFSGVPSLEKGPVQNDFLVAEDASNALGFVVSEELLNQSSPKKKRRRLENAGEDGCKRCNCKKSKCLKLYCECFAAGVYCVEPCSCQECFNKPIHEDTVLATRKQIESRNPLAFAPKVIRSSDSVLEMGDESSKTPASARHKRGCNCKKSGCLKKYCECYQGGVGCSINCRCEGCKNAFGRKDGSETDLEGNDVDECDENGVDMSLPETAMQNETEPCSATPATPSRFGRQLIPLPISSKSKPPRSLLAIGSSSQRFGKLNPFQAPGKFNKQFQTVHEDEIPDILQGNDSPIGGVKSSSPNSKRISPPHSTIRLSPGQRSNRKLILQSIPSFPSLTPKH